MKLVTLVITHDGIPDDRSHLFNEDDSTMRVWTSLCQEVFDTVGTEDGQEFVIKDEYTDYRRFSIFTFPELCEKCKLLKVMEELAE